MTTEEYEPVVVGICCNWCAYAGHDLAGTARIQYPPNIRVVRVMCSGMVHPNHIMDALTKGADGVLLCGCHDGDCHYSEGNIRAQQRVEAIELMMEDFGLEPERFRFERISGSEGEKFAHVVKTMVEELKKVGPSPYKT